MEETKIKLDDGRVISVNQIVSDIHNLLKDITDELVSLREENARLKEIISKT